MKLNLIWLPEGIIGFRRKRVGIFENRQVSWFILRESWHLMTTNAADWYHAGGGRGRLRTEHVDIDTFAREHVASRGIVDVVGVQFRLDRLRAVGWGLVRIGYKDRIQELFDIIDDPSNKDFGDTETTRRVQQQRGQQKLIETDYIVKITAHTTEGGKSRKKTRYSCYWNRPTILTKEKLLKKLHVNPRKSADIRDGQDDDRRRFETQQIEYVEDYITKQMFSEILSFTDGPKQLDIYKALHPTAVFRD